MPRRREVPKRDIIPDPKFMNKDRKKSRSKYGSKKK